MNTASGTRTLNKLEIVVGATIALALLGFGMVWMVLPAQTPATSNTSTAGQAVREYPVYTRHPDASALVVKTRAYPVYVRRSDLSIPGREVRAYPIFTRHPDEGSVQASEEHKPPFTFIRTH
jgi:hypothetical protein